MHLLKTKYTSLLALPLLLVLCVFALPSQKVFASTTYTVTNTDDSGAGSLRQAILDANDHANSGGNDLISFNIAGSGVHTITPETDLPEITDGVTIDGSTQSGASCSTHTLKIEINGGNTTMGIHLGTGSSGSIVKGLVINRVGTGDVGVASFSELKAQALSGNIGILGDGGPPPGAIHVDGSSANNNIVCNFVGTNTDGDSAVPNLGGVVVYGAGSGNVIGGTTAADRNVVSSNAFGILAFSADTLIEGNYVGTNIDGSEAIPGAFYGIYLGEESNITVGGTSAGARNIISGNGYNVVSSGTTGTKILGNYIGTNAAGDESVVTQPLSAVHVTTASDGTVHVNGGDELPPNAIGIALVEDIEVTIGGTATGARNVVSGNLYNIQINEAGLSTIQGNYIGINATGTACLDGSYVGIYGNRAFGNTIGGSTSAAHNVISCAQDTGHNDGQGIYIDSPEANTIQGNYIGTNVSGVVEEGYGNGGEGILLSKGSYDKFNQIGGVNAGEGNVIAGNGGVGIKMLGKHANEDDEIGDTAREPLNNPVLGNSIYSNGGVGIDLLEDGSMFDGLHSAGVTPNDVGDVDDGPNHYLNFPVITGVTSEAGEATITYNLDINDSEVGATGYRVEFFANDSDDPSGHGQGQTYLGYDTVAGDVTGETANITLPNGVDGEKYITATATMTGDMTDTLDQPRTYGSTSEFSATFQATLVNPNSDTDQDNISDTIENSAPNSGDANNDGTPDSEQANVASFVDPVSDEYAVLEVSDECTVSSVSIDEESTPHPDSDFNYPNGLMDFTLDCGTPGFTADITQYYYGQDSTDFVVRKYNPSTKKYTTIDQASISTETIDSNKVTKATYQVKDGGTLDLDNTEDGNIHDPTGLAQTADSLANTGQNTHNIELLAIVLLTSGLAIATYSFNRRRKGTHASTKN